MGNSRAQTEQAQVKASEILIQSEENRPHCSSTQPTRSCKQRQRTSNSEDQGGRKHSNEHQRTLERDDQTPEDHPHDDPRSTTPGRKGQDSSVLLQAALPLGRRLRRRLGRAVGPFGPRYRTLGTALGYLSAGTGRSPRLASRTTSNVPESEDALQTVAFARVHRRHPAPDRRERGTAVRG